MAVVGIERRIEQMYEVANNDIADRLKNVFGSDKDAVIWFFYPKRLLEGRRPYDYCKQGKYAPVEELLVKYSEQNTSLL